MEVLVAVSLLSLLSVGILMALRVGVVSWEQTSSNLALDRRIASANAMFHAAIEGMVQVWGERQTPQMASAMPFLFFQGEPAAMRFVSAWSLEAGPRGGLRLIELQVTEGPRGRRVLMNDRPFPGARGLGALVKGEGPAAAGGEQRLFFAAIPALPTSFILADELEACSFSYQQRDDPSRPGLWVSVWTRTMALPEAVTIQIGARGDSARLRPVNVTVLVPARMRPS